MNKNLLTACLCCTIAWTGVSAQENVKSSGHFSLGLEASTTGCGLELATSLSPNFALRGGVSVMPKYIYTDIFKVTVSEDIQKKINEEIANYPEIKVFLTQQGLPTRAEDINSNIDANATLGFINGKVLLDCYPWAKYSFHFTVGCYIGTSELVKVEGKMDQAVEVLNLLKNYGIDYFNETYIIDQKEGYQITGRDLTEMKGTITTNSFRPYFGLGFGRSVPKSRVGVSFEIGAFYHGTPKIISANANIQKLINGESADVIGDFNKWSFYPVVSLKLNFRLF